MDAAKKQDLIAAAGGIAKSMLGEVPVLGQLIAGWDEYHRRESEQNAESLIATIQSKIADIGGRFDAQWFQTADGRQFAQKIIASALDSQLQDKQELFANALIRGAQQSDLTQLEKLKFADMLRHLSRAALMVLSDMHAKFRNQVRGPGRGTDQTAAFPQVDDAALAAELSRKYGDPYLVTSAIAEMQAQGLFSSTGSWNRLPDGSSTPAGGFATAVCYTDFAARFVEFITLDVPAGAPAPAAAAPAR